jgi:large subunit ribosomal protein L7/L12
MTSKSGLEEKISMEITNQAIVDRISNMTAKQLVELSQELQEKFGISADALAPAAAVAGPVEEKKQSLYRVELVGFNPASKFGMVKFLRATLVPQPDLVTANGKLTGDLKAQPLVIKENLSEEDANKLIEEIKLAGGEAEKKAV